MDANDPQRVLIQRAATAVALGKLDVAEAVAKIASAIDLPARRDKMIAELFRLFSGPLEMTTKRPCMTSPQLVVISHRFSSCSQRISLISVWKQARR